MRQCIRLGAQVSEIWCVIKTQTLLCRLGEVGQLLYEVHLLTASGGLAGRHKFSWKVSSIPTTTFNIIASIPYVICCTLLI